MRLADIPARLIEETVRKWRRRAAALAVIAVCAVVALAETLAAVRLALEAALGPIWARAALAAIFLGLIAITAIVLGSLERSDTAERRSADAVAKDERVSMIAEAINLGYTLARDLRRPATAAASPDGGSESAVPRQKAPPDPGADGRAADREKAS